jgi:hypothetical protein
MQPIRTWPLLAAQPSLLIAVGGGPVGVDAALHAKPRTPDWPAITEKSYVLDINPWRIVVGNVTDFIRGVTERGLPDANT